MADETEIVSPLRHVAEGLATGLFAAAVLAWLVGAARADALPPPKPAAAVHSLRVVDGDTIVVDGDRIRFPDIDTPEIGRPHCAAERALGLEPSGKRDRYGRRLDLVVIDLAGGPRAVGAILIERRLALPWAGRRPNWCAIIAEGW